LGKEKWSSRKKEGLRSPQEKDCEKGDIHYPWEREKQDSFYTIDEAFWGRRKKERKPGIGKERDQPLYHPPTAVLQGEYS